MKVLFGSPQRVPLLLKPEGLADMVGSLPSELLKFGVDARVVILNTGIFPQFCRRG